MTNFEKIKNYYTSFDEDNRLNKDASGKLEFEMTMRILDKYMPQSATILDLGGASGAYTFPLANKGYKMYLADLSENLISIAKKKCKNEKIDNIISCDVVNALDLSIYEDNKFDVVLLFGPLYHLLEESERKQCIKEVQRVLKDNGLLFASFIPYLSGSIAIVDRYFRHPEQVNVNNLEEVFNSGKFINADKKGFQEGYYPNISEIEELFNDRFKKICIKSIRGFGYEREDRIYNIDDKEIFNKILNLIDKTSELREIVETCGHAIYIGKKI